MRVSSGIYMAPTTTGLATFDGVGFRPQVLILWSGGPGSLANGMRLTMGWAAEGRPTSCNALVSLPSVPATQAQRVRLTQEIASNRILWLWQETPGYDMDARFTAFTSNGFTLNWVAAPSAQAPIHWLALADVPNVHIGQFFSPASGLTQSITEPGFRPSLVMFNSTYANIPYGGQFMLGAATAARQAFSGVWETDAVSPTMTRKWQRWDYGIGVLGAASEAVPARAGAVTLTSNGFDVAWSGALPDQRKFNYIAFGGDGFSLMHDTTPTVSMSKATSGLGRRPRGLLFVSTGATDEGISTSDASLSIGAAGTGGAMGGTGITVNDAVQGTFGHGVYVYMQDGVTTTGTSILQIPSIPMWVGPSGLTQYAGFQSFDADGYTLAWQNSSDPVSRRFWTIAFGDPSTTPARTLGTLPQSEGLLPRLISVNRLGSGTTTAMGTIGIWGFSGRELFTGSITPAYDCWVEVYSNITIYNDPGTAETVSAYHVLSGSQFFDAYPYGQPRVGAGADLRGMSIQAAAHPIFGSRWTSAPLKTIWLCEAGKTYRWYLAVSISGSNGKHYWDSGNWSYIYASIVGYA